jgi:hypothetical protein
MIMSAIYRSADVARVPEIDSRCRALGVGRDYFVE